MSDKTERFKRLEKEVMLLLGNLPSDLHYHSIAHTKDVLRQSMRLASMEELNEEDSFILMVAALFHDSGFTRSGHQHEERSCEIAREVLINYDFTEEQIESVCTAIMATKIPQTPLNLISKILCDADLDYLGRSDFYAIGDTLFEEMEGKEVISGRVAWNELQVKFLRQHHYFTHTNKVLRTPLKLAYLKEIEDWLASHKKDNQSQ